MPDPGAATATATVLTVAPSPAFFVAIVLYGLASVLHVSTFVQTPGWVGRAARWSLILAFVAHGIDIGWRGVLAVHPGTSVREALGFLSWVLVGGFLWWTRRLQLSLLGAFVAPVALAILAAARLSPSGEPMEDLGVLGRVHISLAAIGVALFALATGVAVMYLLEERNLKRKKFDRALFKKGVGLDRLDRLAHRLVVVGFPIFTAALVLGVIWVSERGSDFDRPEYPIAFVTWLTFGGLIGARQAVGWRGRRAAMLTIVGFAAAALVLVIYFARRALGG
jgi:ABC-type uncharacterized transport system permease subunit